MNEDVFKTINDSVFEGKLDFGVDVANILLSDKEKDILTRRFSNNESFEEIGHDYLITSERVNQIQSLGLSKIKEYFSGSDLKIIFADEINTREFQKLGLKGAKDKLEEISLEERRKMILDYYIKLNEDKFEIEEDVSHKIR